MRYELLQIKRIEDYLFDRMPEDEKALLDAQMLLEPELKEKVRQQQIAYRIINFFSRNEQRMKFEKIFNNLLQEPAFAQEIKTIFV